MTNKNWTRLLWLMTASTLGIGFMDCAPGLDEDWSHGIDASTNGGVDGMTVGSESNSSGMITGSISNKALDMDPTTDRTPDASAQLSTTPTRCTDEMMGAMVGCLSIASYRHYRAEDPECGCGDNWCTWGACIAGCMPDYAAAAASCYEAHALCGQMHYASWQFCNLGCADDFKSCAAAINCLDASGDVSRCREEQQTCQRSC